MPLAVGVERWPLAKPFAIARGVKTVAETVVARISDGTHTGRGECTPYARYSETPESVVAEIAALRDDFGHPAGPDDAPRLRAELQARLSAGAARNALDCALWDYEAKARGGSVAELAGLTPPVDATTAVTLSLDAPAAMAEAARDAQAPLLKAKLGAGSVSDEAARLRAIRAAAPNAKIIVDANEGWDLDTLIALDPICAEIEALFIEQPLPADRDADLANRSFKTPLCADESAHTAEDAARLVGLFQVVNVKLDKTGGLTGAIALRAAARSHGFDVMIGCMVAGSLAMAPAYLLTEGALAVDLDGPLLLATDRDPPIRFKGTTMFPPEPALWG